MAKTTTDEEIVMVIENLKAESSRDGFKNFMRERKKLIYEKGKEVAEAELKVKHKDKIDAIKAKKNT